MIDPKRLITLENFLIPQLDRKRTIRIYLPRGYETSTKYYPTLYMHDGQNMFYDNWCFSGQSWKACETLDHLEHETGGIILVTIESSQMREGLARLDEYSPWEKNFFQNRVDTNWKSQQNFGGEGDAYANFVVTTLKDYVDSHFRTKKGRENNFIGGSSMGALISLYIGIKYSDQFSKLALVSPAFWFAYDDLVKYLQNTQLKNDLYIYLDIGTQETSDQSNPNFPSIYLDSTHGIEKILRSKVTALDYFVFEGQQHNEKAWSLRFPQIIKRFIKK